ARRSQSRRIGRNAGVRRDPALADAVPDAGGALARKAHLALRHRLAADLRDELGVLGRLAAELALIVHARARVLLARDPELRRAALRAFGADLTDAEFHELQANESFSADTGSISCRRITCASRNQ